MCAFRVVAENATVANSMQVAISNLPTDKGINCNTVSQSRCAGVPKLGKSE
jgi:hypothetical protein